MISSDAQLHPSALVERGAKIGKGTRVWAFVHVLPGARIGEDCNICDHVFIENDVEVGNRVTIKSGVQLWDGITLDDDVFVGPNATFTNDKFPRSKSYPEQFAATRVHAGASIGANATVLPGVEIGAGAMVGAGAVVTRDIPPKAIAMGNPARIVGYVGAEGEQVGAPDSSGQVKNSSVGAVRLYELQHAKDLRGDLSAIEWEKELPFCPKRAFFVYEVPNARIRSEHAHKACHQFLLCVHGSVVVVVDDGQCREEFRLSEPHVGLHIPPGVWAIREKFSADAVLCVLASHGYDSADYIRDYEKYLDFLK